jgi:pimeloyl-ACP methyl ester carboxylesterase
MTRESAVVLETGLRLHVVEWGAADGWPLLILHGGGHDAGCWAEVCRRLPPELRVVVPDQRGHGASDRSATGDYSCAAQVGDLVALLRELAIERCALVGHSMGGLNALRFAGSRPEQVSALVLIDVGTETRRSGLARLSRRASTGDARPRSPAVHKPAPEALRAPFESFDRRLLEFVPTYGGDAQERRRLLAASGAPLLVMRGQHSRILSSESAARSASLGGGRVVEIPDAGHNVSLDNPEAVAEALSRFFAPLARIPHHVS